jgi:hypothetical protein
LSGGTVNKPKTNVWHRMERALREQQAEKREARRLEARTPRMRPSVDRGRMHCERRIIIPQDRTFSMEEVDRIARGIVMASDTRTIASTQIGVKRGNWYVDVRF